MYNSVRNEVCLHHNHKESEQGPSMKASWLLMMSQHWECWWQEEIMLRNRKPESGPRFRLTLTKPPGFIRAHRPTLVTLIFSECRATSDRSTCYPARLLPLPPSLSTSTQAPHPYGTHSNHVQTVADIFLALRIQCEIFVLSHIPVLCILGQVQAKLLNCSG